MASDFNTVVDKVAEIMQFETWLRFYFLEGEEDDLSMAIPEEHLEMISRDWDYLSPLAKSMNGQTIDYEKSRSEVCSFIGASLADQDVNTDHVPRALDSRPLRLEMHLFHLWINGHEDVLDEETMSFGQWREGFASWRNTEEVKKFAEQLATPENVDNSCNTVQ